MGRRPSLRHSPPAAAPAQRHLAWGLAAVCVAATTAWAVTLHTELESSVPADGAVLRIMPAEFELRFTGPVDAALSAMSLVLPGGDSLRISLSTAGGDSRVLTGLVPPNLEPGAYGVSWRTVSADGHPVSGRFGFRWEPQAGAGASGRAVDDPGSESVADSGSVSEAEPGSGPADGSTGGPGVGPTLLSGLGMLCLLAFAGILWFVGSLPLLREPRVGGAVRFLGWAALLLIVAELAVWSAEVVPPGAGIAGAAAALGSPTGSSRIGQVLLIALALAALSRHGRAAAVLALAAVLTGAVSGHAAAYSPLVTMPANAVHVGAASIWLGGVLTLLLVPGEPAAGGPDWRYADLVSAVSGAALLSVLLIAGSGAIQAARLVGGLDGLTGSAYGRGVLAKWAGFLILIGFGAVHRRRAIPVLRQEEDARLVRRTARLESLVMLAVVMLAAWLARVSPPAAY